MVGTPGKDATWVNFDFEGSPTGCLVESPRVDPGYSRASLLRTTCKFHMEELEEVVGGMDVWTAVIVSATINVVQICSLKVNGGGVDLRQSSLYNSYDDTFLCIKWLLNHNSD